MERARFDTCSYVTNGGHNRAVIRTAAYQPFSFHFHFYTSAYASFCTPDARTHCVSLDAQADDAVLVEARKDSYG